MNQDTSLPADDLEKGFHTLAHDWRNVLNGINLQLLSAQTAADEEERDAELAQIQVLIGTATKALAALVRKISRPVLHLAVYPTSFLVEDLSAALKKQSDRLFWPSHPGAGTVNVDFEALQQALGELSANSLRHLSEGQSLQLETQETADSFSITLLEITSTPVTPSSWGKFPFTTTDKNRLGLGIYYARRVVEAHGGELRFEFSPANSTLRTSLCLPLFLE